MSKTVAPTAQLPANLPPAPSATMVRPGVRGTPAAPYATTDHERRELPAGAVDLRDRTPSPNLLAALRDLAAAVTLVADVSGSRDAHALGEKAKRFAEAALRELPGDGVAS